MSIFIKNNFSSKLYGQLFVVATPIGNLGEMSPRAIETLKSVDLIACEDTRITKKLCRVFHINTPLISYYREIELEKSEFIINKIVSGKNIALVSDAGTPAVSDPGAILVRKARDIGIKVLAIAGPCAFSAAISVAGLQSNNFVFAGFLPANSSERRKKILNMANLPFPIILYESPHRIQKVLIDLAQYLGDRRVQILRELTKIHEEYLEGTLSELAQRLAYNVKGELVVIVHNEELKDTIKPESIDELICWYRDVQHASLKDAVRSISSDLDLPRTKVYKRALLLWEDGDSMDIFSTKDYENKQ